ncbi:MAG: helix-turn-helix domain-containing protein [Clostridia bacterium]|nr:helix-turn-helix domain-containing protein [Clostridia bacterium]
MPREYRHIKQYEKEIIELWEQGVCLQEIAERFGFTKEQVQEIKTRYNKNQRKLAAGISIL